MDGFGIVQAAFFAAQVLCCGGWHGVAPPYPRLGWPHTAKAVCAFQSAVGQNHRCSAMGFALPAESPLSEAGAVGLRAWKSSLRGGQLPQAWVWRCNAMKILRMRYPKVQAAFCIHSSRSIGSQEKILLNRRFHSGASGSFVLADCVCGSYHCMRPCGSSRTW